MPALPLTGPGGTEGGVARERARAAADIEVAERGAAAAATAAELGALSAALAVTAAEPSAFHADRLLSDLHSVREEAESQAEEARRLVSALDGQRWIKLS